MTSVGSETSICSMGQLGDTIANSEREEQDQIYLVEKLYRINFRLPVFVCIFFSSFKRLVGLQEAGLRFVLSRRSDRLPHRGSASPFPRLLLGVHRCGSFCSPAGEPTDFFSPAASAASDAKNDSRIQIRAPVSDSERCF